MAGDAEQGETEWETIDHAEEDLDGDDAVDEAGKDLFRYDGVLLDDFG